MSVSTTRIGARSAVSAAHAKTEVGNRLHVQIDLRSALVRDVTGWSDARRALNAQDIDAGLFRAVVEELYRAELVQLSFGCDGNLTSISPIHKG